MRQYRFYRNFIEADDLKKIEITVKETDILFLLDRSISRDFLKEKIIKYRDDIESYIKTNGEFFTTLEPLDVSEDAPPIVKEMADVAKKTGIGPMAGVAGAISDFLGRDLLGLCSEVIIENGGDIFLKSEKARYIRIYTGEFNPYKRLNLEVKSEGKLLGVCTSSGKIGHSLSFGNADLVTVISDRAVLADSVATQTANLVKTKTDIEKAVDFAKNILGVKGVVIIFDDVLASFGEIQFVT